VLFFSLPSDKELRDFREKENKFVVFWAEPRVPLTLILPKIIKQVRKFLQWWDGSRGTTTRCEKLHLYLNDHPTWSNHGQTP